MSVVILPNFNRPEFLTICLEQIQKADNWNKYSYLFAYDYGFDPVLLNVYKNFKGVKHLIKTDNQIAKGNITKIMKQSYNVLNAWRAAASMTDENIFLIEDDIMIGKDFFTLHEEILNLEPDVMVSIATENHNTRYSGERDINTYYVSNDPADYQSLGICVRKQFITDYVEPHCTRDYFTQPGMYCRVYFEKSKIGAEFCEQDGLIRRIKEQNNIKTAFPTQPRAYHAGFYGKNRGIYPGLSMDRKIGMLKKIIFDKQEMHLANKGNEYFDFDSCPVPLDTQFTELKRI